MTKDCEICKQPFQVKPGKAAKRFCCSKKCQAERFKYSMLGEKNGNYRNAKTKTFNCVSCKKDFRLDTYMNKGRKTCSKECYTKNVSLKHTGKKMSVEAVQRAMASKEITLRNKGVVPKHIRTKCKCGAIKDEKAVTCIKCFHNKIRRTSICRVCGKTFYGKVKAVKCCSKECVQQRRFDLSRGENNPRWKGGVKPEHQRQRQHLSYKEWRTSVYTRDKFTCQDCGKTNCYLHAHHIKEFSKFPELRTDVSNGKTLCVSCHKKYHPSMNIKKYKPQNAA